MNPPGSQICQPLGDVLPCENVAVAQESCRVGQACRFVAMTAKLIKQMLEIGLRHDASLDLKARQEPP